MTYTRGLIALGSLIPAAMATSEVAPANIIPAQIIYKDTPSVFSASFAYGLIAGQLSVLIVFIVFIRFFIFADASPQVQPLSSNNRTKIKVLPAASSGVNTILEKTYYNVDNHPAESLDWFTVLIAQVISQIREDAKANDNILKTLNSVLNGDKIPDFLDKINVTELNIGDDYPIFSNCKILQRSDGEADDELGGLEAHIDVDLADTITLGIETRLLLNFPKTLVAFLPVSLAVSIVRFSGRLTVSLRKQSNSEGPGTTGQTYLTFSFSPDYRLEFSVKSLVGARSRLQDVPKIGQIVESRLRKWFTDRCVAPRYQQIPLPSFWPRSKFTKEHSGLSNRRMSSTAATAVKRQASGTLRQRQSGVFEE
uniref:Maintenance of mitochondrial morphology protein 1 n=1 Tax=Blastobotrys adeninivorans TaxID=409370 RepID=A0A060TD74_BLAAD